MGLFDSKPPVEGEIKIDIPKMPPKVLEMLFRVTKQPLKVELPAIYVHSGTMDVGYDKTTYTLEFTANDIVFNDESKEEREAREIAHLKAIARGYGR
jgi:hypothetical protein